MLNRRSMLLSGLASPVAWAGRAWAAPQSGSRLLVVFLRGAYDAANVVIPSSQSFYYEARPSLKIAKPDQADPNASLALDADWSLHPALKDTVYPLWQRGQAAFVPFAGTDDMTRSHFESQDTIELGQPVQGSRNYRSGFLGRLNDEISGAVPIAFTDQLSLIFRGDQMIANLPLNSLGRPPLDPRQAKLIEDMYRNQPLARAVSTGMDVRDRAYRSIAAEVAAASRGAATAKGFELSARRIAMLMRSTYNLAFVDVGGWDTHVNQGASAGALAGRLAELGQGLAGFADELGPEAWNKTTVIIVSEFGRTFRENGDRGTDHGHGSTYWVLGGGVKGRRIVGDQVKLTPETLNQGRDYPVLTDYRALIGGLLAQIYGLSGERLGRVFPGVAPKDLGLI